MKTSKWVCAVVISLFVLIASCKTPCSDPGLAATFEGFDSSDLSVIIIEKYERGTGFIVLRQRIVTGTAFTGYNNGDTIDILKVDYTSINSQQDTWIKLPVAGKEFKIRDISFTEEKESQTSDRCSNTVHYYLNDVSYQGRGYGYDGWVNAVKVILKP